jgi:hypothetical protein
MTLQTPEMQLIRMSLLLMKQSCSAANVATKSLATMKNSIDILEFIQVKNHLVVFCVANLFHREELWRFTINIFILMAIK